MEAIEQSDNYRQALATGPSDEDAWSDTVQALIIFPTHPSSIAFRCNLMIRFTLWHGNLTINEQLSAGETPTVRLVLKTKDLCAAALAASGQCIIF